MILYAVLSDIHANYEALRAVARDARKQAKKEQAQLHFVCLGDVVDYGPQPNECMAWVRKNVSPGLFVRGNHDQDVVTHGPPQTIHSDYWPIHLWTRWKLKSQHKKFLEEHKEWKRLSPDALHDFTLFHGSLFGVDGRVAIEELAKANMEHLQTPYGLFGHTHFQGCFCTKTRNRRGKFQEILLHLTVPEGYHQKIGPIAQDALFHEFSLHPAWMPLGLNEWHPLPSLQRVLLNPGSVGQPRRHAFHKDNLAGVVPHDYRAAYLLLALNGDGPGRFQFRRVPYKVEKTAQLLREIQYPQEAKVTYASIDQDRGGGSVRNLDNLGERLRYTQEHIHQLLPRLIEETLIPTLLEGQ